MSDKMSVTRKEINWCDGGYHEITKQAYQGVWFYFGSIGAAICLLNDNLDHVSGNGYHSIDLVKGEAMIGAKKYSFNEHLTMER